MKQHKQLKRTTELLRVDKLSQLEVPTKIQQVQKLQALQVLYTLKKEPTPFNWNIRTTFKE
jgi:hypothetical protein